MPMTTTRRAARLAAAGAVLALALSACSDDSAPEPSPATEAGTTATGTTAEPETTTEPSSEPTPEATTEPEPEPSSEPTPEVTSEPEPEVTSDPEPTSETEPESTSEPEPEPTEEASAQPEGQAATFDVADQVVFTTPARAAYCRMVEDRADTGPYLDCEVQDSTVEAEAPLKGACPEGFGFYRQWFPGQEGHWSCNYYEGITSGHLEIDSDDDWIAAAGTETDTLPSGQVIGVLGYDQTLRMSTLARTVRPDGLTCSTTDGDHGFTVNTAVWTQW